VDEVFLILTTFKPNIGQLDIDLERELLKSLVKKSFFQFFSYKRAK